MKIRSLHPSFFSDAKVCRLSPTARVLFAGLWCYADDYGRGKWLPKSIEGAVFPRDVVDIQTLLNEVLRAGLIRIYTDGTDDFYEVPSWDEYQSPKYRGKTDVPDPETLENPYRTGPGQFSPILEESSLELSQGEGVGVGEGVGEGVVALTRDRDPIWDALVELFGEPAPASRSLYGRVTKYLRSVDATPDQMRERAAALAVEWADRGESKRFSVAALEKWWSSFDGLVGQAAGTDVRELKRDRDRENRLAVAAMLDEERRALEA